VTSPRRATGRAGEEVSELDKRIIEHLQQDGRRPFTQIAADLGVSEAAVRARTNRLVDRGILQVVGVTDPLKLGFQQMAMIGIRCEADHLMDVAARCAEMPEVDYVVITAGTYDILIETVCEDNDGLLRFLSNACGRSTGCARRRRSCTSGWSSSRTSGARVGSDGPRGGSPRPAPVRAAPRIPAATDRPPARSIA
jgi:Lrp/AsnC family transcriptional regulator for asnA, asnC and gidA